MASNFSFLKEEFPEFYSRISRAEQRIYTEPDSAGNLMRVVLEGALIRIFEYEGFDPPFQPNTNSLLTDYQLKGLLPGPILNGLHYVRTLGNRASHFGNVIRAVEVLTAIKHLYPFLKWFARDYSQAEPDIPGPFDESLIPKEDAHVLTLREKEAEYKVESQKLEELAEALKKENERLERLAKENQEAFEKEKAAREAIHKALEKRKLERKQPIPTEFTEAETRQHLIDASLAEAGWTNLRQGRELEFPVTGMPVTRHNPKSNGFADYVLWDTNGKPLAVIEAKKAMKDAEIGRHQAFLYANALEEMFGQRPVIFYTNGYETFIWDDTFYAAPRRVHGFYTLEQLQAVIRRRDVRTDPRGDQPDPEIAGRAYQAEAIGRVMEAFAISGKDGRLMGARRAALLSMATGSGKTRTSAALVDMLYRHNWVRRVLFLADRTALVSQAKDAFGKFLPSLAAVDLTREKENDTSRLVFSTYPTMMNQIDSARNQGKILYGPGHFDLIIVDEAHRSVYNKFGAIFEYFDALLLGLTATPKDSVDHDTYGLFDCPVGDPTFEYSLGEAVDAGYLVDFENIPVTTRFMRDGIKYDELSPEEQEQYEATFRDEVTGLFPEEISNSAMNKTLFNEDTAFKVLDELMEKGLKIEGGDKIGRTIIFAVNHRHAEFIFECFKKRYPDYPPDFISVVHNKVSHSETLIKSFCDHFEEKMPQIAISVDMMDTGIDAPRVLNLVFFKIVRSYAKFWQMIGRGTRLCPDIFGPGEDKDGFRIFDVCGNFEFFAVNPKGNQPSSQKSLSTRIFEARLQLSQLLLRSGEPENVELAAKQLDMLHGLVQALDEGNQKKRFEVQMARRFVDRFKDRAAWNNLSEEDVKILNQHLASLPRPEGDHENTRRFDLLTLKMQIAKLLAQPAAQKAEGNLIQIAEVLGQKYALPDVANSRKLIESMKDPDFYRDLTQKRIDAIREEIRDLMAHLEKREAAPVYTNFRDETLEISGVVTEPPRTYGSAIYKKRVEKFIRENKNLLTIRKLNTNEPLTEAELHGLEEILFDGDERGTYDDFIANYGEKPLGAFIRSIIGLDAKTANDLFAKFLQSGSLRPDQMKFIQTIIAHLTRNGVIDKKMLFEPPFTDVHDQGLLGVFDEVEVGNIISILDDVNRNAGVA